MVVVAADHDELIGEVALAGEDRADVVGHDGRAFDGDGERDGGLAELDGRELAVGGRVRERAQVHEAAALIIGGADEAFGGLSRHHHHWHLHGAPAGEGGHVLEACGAGVIGAGGVDEDDRGGAGVGGAAELAVERGGGRPALTFGPEALALGVHGLEAVDERDLAGEVRAFGVGLIAALVHINIALDAVADEDDIARQRARAGHPHNVEVRAGRESHSVATVAEGQ